MRVGIEYCDVHRRRLCGGTVPRHGVSVWPLTSALIQYVRWSGEKLPSLPAVSLHLDSHVLAMLCMRQPRYILILVSSHEPNLIHNLKVISAHSDCTKIVVASMARPPSEEEQQAYAAFVGTELQPVTVDIYHVQASAIKLLEADETVSAHPVYPSPYP